MTTRAPRHESPRPSRRARSTLRLARSTRPALAGSSGCASFTRLAAALVLCAGARVSLAVTISEIHYNPLGLSEDLEFIELTNDSATPEDISGYSFIDGISFEIPSGTVLGGYERLVVCANAEAVRTRYGISNAIGDYLGRLDNSGDRVTLANHAGVRLVSVRYRDAGKWPVTADGTGHSLVLRNVHADPGEPESWTRSPEPGGSPGLANFPDEMGPEIVEEILVDAGETWRFRRGSSPFSSPAEAWISPAFNDASWEVGPSGFGFGDDDDATVLEDMAGSYASLAIRKQVTLSAADLDSDGSFFLGVDYDDGFVAFLNGAEIARVNVGSPGEIPIASDSATSSHEAGAEELFEIPRETLMPGENTLAIAGYNLNANSSDFSLRPRLLLRRTVSAGPVAVEDRWIARDATWRWRRGVAPFSSPSNAWRERTFDDASWEEARAGFGYATRGPSRVAYNVPSGLMGNQEYDGALGMDFDVLEDIRVTRLGVFDSGADGLARAITARLYNRDTLAEVARLDFTPASQGALVGGSRFKDLATPVDLPAGFRGTIAASGYGAGEPNGNQGSATLGLTTDDADGAIAFVGGGRFGANANAFPDQVDGGPADRYAAGTFELTRGNGAGTIVRPAGTTTLLDDMPGAYASLAVRASFELTEKELSLGGETFLGIDHDDGFVAYLNGVEIARVAAAPGAIWSSLATSARSSGGEALLAVPAEALRAGTNVLAILGLNVAVDDVDFVLTPRLFRRRLIDTGMSASDVVVNELHRASDPGASWVELYNAGLTSVDLSGHLLTESPDRANPYVFPPGTTLAPGAFLAMDARTSGLTLDASRTQVFLLSPTGVPVSAATFNRDPSMLLASGTWSECRYPDGGPLDWVSTTPTRAAANRVDRTDALVINEIFYHPPEERRGEFLELYNRSDTTVDLGGMRFDAGIDFLFPGGTLLAPDAYLVLAEDPALLLEHHGVTALGPYAGQLSNSGEQLRLVDALGNPVDEVRYHEGGRWPKTADGDGSSLELIDPWQDNRVASAWTASDESGKAAWQSHSFRVASYVPAAESELHLHLVERGAIRVDDISIRRAGGANLIPNGDFESSTAGWLIGGTHVRSRRITNDSLTGNACLEIDASGKGDTLVNRLEIETSPRLTAGPYDVSLATRWQRGSSVLVVHGEYHAGPYRTTPCITCGVAEPNLNGNSLSAAIHVAVPFNLGTPGAENSARRRLREDTGSDNLGPVIDQVEHRPPMPAPSDPAIVTARVADFDGVVSVSLHYRTTSPVGPFDTLPLFDDGLHADLAPADGIFGGTLPGFPNGTRVVFYIEAQDALGAVRRYPVAAPDETCLYLVQTARTGGLDDFTIVLDAAAQAELQTRQLHSNDLVPGAFVFENESSHYSVGVRYRGSPWGRPGRSALRVRFPEDDRFHRGRRDMNLSKTGSSANEGAGLFLIGRSGIPGKPAPAADYHWVDVWLNGGSFGRKGDIEVLDGDFVEKWQGPDARGPLLKANGRFVFNDAGGLIGQTGWEGASLVWRHENPENYRGYFFHAMRQSAEDWGPLIDLVRTLDRGETPDALFGEIVGDVVDLDAFFRVVGTRILLGDGDGWLVNNGHNGHLLFNSVSGRWGALAFDTEAAFRGNFDLLASLDPGVQRLLDHPVSRRVYFRTLSQSVRRYWSNEASAWLNAVTAATGFSTGGIRNHIASNATRVRSLISSAESIPFRIVTNGGADFETSEASVELAGDAPVGVETILVSVNGGALEEFETRFSSLTRWSAEVSLDSRETEIELLAFDGLGELAGTDSITITSTGLSPLDLASVGPIAGPRAGGQPVTLQGSGFAAGLRVLFGGIASTEVSVSSDTIAIAVAPAAPIELPEDGLVDVEVRLGGASARLVAAYRYQGSPSTPFARADANADSRIDLSDAVAILGYLFGGAAAPPCLKAADFDASGDLVISDPVGVLNFLFLAGRPPAPPYPGCGVEVEATGLSCERHAPCG